MADGTKLLDHSRSQWSNVLDLIRGMDRWLPGASKEVRREVRQKATECADRMCDISESDDGPPTGEVRQMAEIGQILSQIEADTEDTQIRDRRLLRAAAGRR